MTELRPNRRKDEPPFYLAEERYFTPNHAQLSAAVKGNDPRHRIRPKRGFWIQQFLYALLVLILLCAAFGSLFVIAAALR